jgi:hypothetical protein
MEQDYPYVNEFIETCESLQQFLIEMYPYGESEDGKTFDEEVYYQIQEFETRWGVLVYNRLPGVDGLAPACNAMLDSLDNWIDFGIGWNVNRRNLYDAMRNCISFQHVLDRLQAD